MNITLQQILALDAVVSQGSLQAAASYLHKTHPSVITSLRKLEDELGFALFDRSGYRTILTEEGRLFRQRSRSLLVELHQLGEQAEHIRDGEAAELNIILGDVTPKAEVLQILRRFVEEHTYTGLNLYFENISGPNQRLLAGEVDMIVHHIDKADPRYEYKDFCRVPVVPVVAPGFLDMPITDALGYSDLRDYTQCIIRDTGDTPGDNYFVLPESPHITVGDQYTKKEIILQRMGWGHMPLFMIQEELDKGQLISIEGSHVRGNTVDIVIARLSGQSHGVMAERLWENF